MVIVYLRVERLTEIKVRTSGKREPKDHRKTGSKLGFKG